MQRAIEELSDIKDADVIAQRAREIAREGREREDQRHDEYDDPTKAGKPDRGGLNAPNVADPLGTATHVNNGMHEGASLRRELALIDRTHSASRVGGHHEPFLAPSSAGGAVRQLAPWSRLIPSGSRRWSWRRSMGYPQS